MRVVPTAEYSANTAFYFDDFQNLVVPEGRIPKMHPEVECLEGRAYIAEVVPPNGSSLLTEHSGLDWQAYWPFEEGARLQAISGYNRFDVLGYFENDQQGLRPGVNRVSGYELQADDRIISESEGIFSRDITVTAASEGLPGKTAGFENDTWYVPRAIITGANKLVTWGEHGVGDRMNADLVIANNLVESKADLRILARQLGQFSLLGRLNVNRSLSTYLTEFAERVGVDYRPTVDPFERYDEFDA